jgi:UDP-glucose 4-epimerase
VHKLAVERYLQVYGQVNGLACTTARLTNPYGPGQPSERTAYGVVNRMIHQALGGDAIPVYGDGRQRRDYIYVDDAVAGILKMGESPASTGRTYNVGSGVGTPLVDMARAITRMAGTGRLEMIGWPQLAEQIETGDFVADIGRIRGELGWEPRVSLTEGLERTVAFYRAHAA